LRKVEFILPETDMNRTCALAWRRHYRTDLSANSICDRRLSAQSGRWFVRRRWRHAGSARRGSTELHRGALAVRCCEAKA